MTILIIIILKSQNKIVTSLNYVKYEDNEVYLRKVIENDNFKQLKIEKFKNDTVIVTNFTDLSYKFDYKLVDVFNNPLENSNYLYDLRIVKVFDKKTNKLIQKIYTDAEFIYIGYLEINKENEQEMSMSYITKKNIDRQIVDGYAGDFVVLDLNFDNKEDFAIIRDYGGAAGPNYQFFIQNDSSKFECEKFLTYEMEYFPDKIDTINYQIINYDYVNYVIGHEKHFQYDTLSKKWSLLKSFYIDIRTGKLTSYPK